MHSTNYFSTLIEVAEDTRATTGVIPPMRGGKKTVAYYEYEMVSMNPYKYTSDDVIFSVYAVRNDIPKAIMDKERCLYFAKGRPCFRASPLTKVYGWGVHSNNEGKIALFSVDSREYSEMLKDQEIVKKKAMRSQKSSEKK